MPENLGIVAKLGLDTQPAMRNVEALANHAERRLSSIKGLNSRGFTRPLGEITSSLEQFTKSLDASNARVLAFGASAGIIYGITEAFSQLANSTIKVEKALTDINVILGLSSSNLRKFKDELFEISRSTAQSFDEVSKAATEFSRQGLGMEETLKRTRDALVLTRLSGLDAVSSVEALTAAVNSFTNAALDSTQIINKLANVDAAFAVSSADLAEAIKRVGSSAQDVGVDIDELIGIVTSAQQTTARGGAVIGTALKSIFTRIQRPEVLSQLEKLGIVVRDMEGNTRPALKILEELARGIDKFNDAQKSQIEESVGSVYQINILKATLADLSKEYNVYNKARQISASADDEAIRRNEELNKTLSALIQKTKANLTQLGSSIGESTISPLADNLLKIVNGAVEGLSKDSTKGLGGTLGKGIVEGIGEFISGPGIILLGGVIVKLVSKFAGDVSAAFKSLLSLDKAAKESLAVQSEINRVLSQNPEIIANVYDKTNQLLTSEQKLALLHNEVLTIIRNENVERAKSVKLAQDLALATVATGNKGTILQTGSKKASAGLIPNFSNEFDKLQEKMGAMEGGYAPGQIREMYVKGMGMVTYNSNERVKDFGMGQPAIMPPETSKAGRNYRKAFKDKHGVDPYAASGLVPNYARRADDYRVIDARGFVKPSETMGVGINAYLHGAHADTLKSFKGESLEDLLEYLMESKPAAIDDAIKKGLMKKAAKGLVPNFAAKELGDGVYGSFYDTGKKREGLSVGFKKFLPTKLVQNSIRREFRVSEALSKANLPPIIQIPKIFGNLKRSLERKKLGKEVIHGLTADNFVGSLPTKFESKADAVLARVSLFLEDNIREKGIEPKDLHGGNYMLNNTAVEEFKGIIKDPKRFKAFKTNPSEAYEAIAKKGGRVAIVDPGEFRINYAQGLVPNIPANLKKAFNKGQHFKDFYKDYRSGLASTGLPPEDADLFNRIYASISYGANDKTVLEVASNIFKKVKSGGPAEARKYTGKKFLGKLGLVDDRAKALQKGFNNERLGTGAHAKTNYYLQALRGDDNALAIDRNFIAAALGEKGGRRKVTSDLRTTLQNAASEVSRELGISPSQLQAAVFAGQRSNLKGKRGETSFAPFANTFEALKKAINREVSAGVPKNNIRVSYASNLASKINPLGLGVHNTQDEPQGLQQGISRALRHGKDPKTYGAAGGLIPNFASFERKPGSRRVSSLGVNPAFNSAEVYNEAIQGDIEKKVKALEKEIEEGKINEEQINKKRKSITKYYALTEKGAKALSDRVDDAVRNRSFNTPKGKIGEILAGKAPDFSATVPARVLGTQPPAVFNPLSLAPQQVLDPRAIVARTGRQHGPTNFRNLDEDNAFGPQLPTDHGPTLGEAALASSLRRKTQAEAAGTLKSLIPFTGAYKSARDLKNSHIDEDREAFRDSRGSLNSRLTMASFGVSFAAPIISNVAEQAIGTNTQAQRIAGAGVGALGNVTSLAAAGLAFGPAGAAIGGSLGVLSSLPTIFEALSDELPEFQRALDAVRDSISNSSEAALGYVKANETLANIATGKTKTSPENTLKLQQDRLNFLARLSPQRQQDVVGAKSQTELRSALDRFAVEDSNKLRSAESKALFKAFEKDIGFGFFSNTTLEEDRADKKGTTRTANNVPRSLSALDKLSPSFKTIEVFGKKLSEEASAKFAPTKNLLLDSSGVNKKSLVQTLIESPEFAGELRSSIGKGDEFFQKLTRFGEISGNNVLSAVAGSLKNSQKPELKDAATKEFSEVLDVDNLQKLREANQREIQKDQKRSQTINQFEDALLDAIITVNKFQSDLETANEIGLNSLFQDLERTRVSEQGSLARNEFFSGGQGIAGIQNQFSINEINRRAQAGRAQADTNFSNQFNGTISNKSVQFLQNRFSSASDGDEFDLADSQKRAFDFFGLGNFIEDIKKQSPTDARASLGNVEKKVDVLINSLQNRIDSGTSTSQEERQQIDFLRDVKINLKQASEEYINSLKKVDAAQKEEIKTQEEINRQNLQIIRLQNEIALGGGIGNVLNNSRALPSAVNDASFLARQGNNAASSNGLFQIAKLADSFGAEIDDTLREKLVDGLSEEIEKSMKALGLSFKSGSARDVARTQVNNEFKFGRGGPGLRVTQGQPARTGFIASTPQELEVREQLRRITSDEAEASEHIESVNKRVEKLREQNVAHGKSALVVEREIQQLLAEEAKLLGEHAFRRNEISGAQLQQLQASKSAAKIENGTYGLNDSVKDFSTQFQYNAKDFYKDISDGAVDLGQTLKGSFKDAFKSFADGSKSAKDAWRDFALSIASKVTDKTLDVAVDTLFSVGAKGISAAFGKGGFVKGYSSGGKVTGGSGSKDDVPALLTSGEFVVRKAAVEKIGEDKLNALNTSKNVNLLFNNRFDYDDVKRPTKGTAVVDKILSAEALDDTNNPQNRLRVQMEEDLMSYVADKKNYDKQKKAANKAYKRGLNASLISAYTSAAITVGGAYAGTKFGGPGPMQAGPTRANYGGWSGGYAQSNGPQYAARGGLIRGYAMGGPVFGGVSATDNVPAMLMGGEYVVRKDVVQKHGVDFFNRLNNGQVIGRASGGLVGNDAPILAGATGSEELSESITRLIAIAESINEKIEKDKNTKEDSTKPAENKGEKANGTTNNHFSFHITIDKNGGVESSATGDSEQNQKNNAESENMRRFSELIKNKCIEVIVKEQRPGGLLSEREKR